MLRRLGFPDVGTHRRFVTAIGIDAIGSGVWMPVSMLYFLATTDLSLVQVGLALSLASVIGLPAAVLVGQQVDKRGSKQVLQIGNVLQAVSFAAYPFVGQVWSVTLVVAVSVIGRTAFWGSYAPLVTLIAPPGEREKWFGFLGALRNAGFAVGGVLAGAALTIGSTPVYTAVVALNALSYVASLVLLAGVSVPSDPASAHAGGERPDPAETIGGWGTVLRDRGYRWLLASNLAYAMTSSALNVAIPVYVVQMLGLPGWVSASVFIINTLLIGLGQGLVVERMTGSIRARIVALAAVLTAASFLLLLGARPLGAAAAIAVILVAAVVYTLGEMVGGPVLATLAAESPPAHLRGRYIATWQLSWNLASGIAPLLYAWLLASGSVPAMLGLTAIALAGAVATGPMRRRLPDAGRPVTNQAEPVGA